MAIGDATAVLQCPGGQKQASKPSLFLGDAHRRKWPRGMGFLQIDAFQLLKWCSGHHGFGQRFCINGYSGSSEMLPWSLGPKNTAPKSNRQYGVRWRDDLWATLQPSLPQLTPLRYYNSRIPQ